MRALRKVEQGAFDATRAVLVAFELEPFVAMIDQISRNGECSGKFADKEWPRTERLVLGQKHLVEVVLPDLVKFQKGVRAMLSRPPAPQ